MIRASKFVSALFLAAVGFFSANGAFAQTGPSGPVAPVVNPAQPSTVQTVGIAEADLLNVLRALDPNVKVKPIKEGTEYSLNILRDGWNFQLRISTFATDMWIDAALGEATANVQKAPVDMLAQLLQENYKIGPTHYSLVKRDDGRLQLYLGRNLERGLMTAVRLRGAIDQFCKHCKDSYPVWSAYTNAVK